MHGVQWVQENAAAACVGSVLFPLDRDGLLWSYKNSCVFVRCLMPCVDICRFRLYSLWDRLGWLS